MANWLYTVNLKSLLENNDTSPEHIIKICNKAKSELRSIEKISHIRLHPDDFNTIDELNSVIDNFDFLKGLCNGNIPENDWDDYSFDGNFEDLCNNCLNEMYDIGDSVVILKNKAVKKFFWVR